MVFIWYDRSRDRLKNSIFKFDWVCLGVGVLSFHNFGTLSGQLKTRYDEAFGEKQKGDLYHKRNSMGGWIVIGLIPNCFNYTICPNPSDTIRNWQILILRCTHVTKQMGKILFVFDCFTKPSTTCISVSNAPIFMGFQLNMTLDIPYTTMKKTKKCYMHKFFLI